MAVLEDFRRSPLTLAGSRVST